MRKEMMTGKNVKGTLGILIAAIVLCSGCGSSNEITQSESRVEATDTKPADAQTNTAKTNNVQTDTAQTTAVPKTEVQPAKQDEPQGAQSGEDLDVIEPGADDETWYMTGNVYTDDTGRSLEVFFDDYGTLEFAVDGLSLYYTSIDKCQQENNWKIYACDDGTTIVYYPGDPAHLEISDGEYAGLYEAGGDKVE